MEDWYVKQTTSCYIKERELFESSALCFGVLLSARKLGE